MGMQAGPVDLVLAHSVQLSLNFSLKNSKGKIFEAYDPQPIPCTLVPAELVDDKTRQRNFLVVDRDTELSRIRGLPGNRSKPIERFEERRRCIAKYEIEVLEGV